MPTYQYRIKVLDKENNRLIEDIIEVMHSYTFLDKLEELPQSIKDKISYKDEEGNIVFGERVIAAPYLGGFNEYGTSKSVKFNASNI